MNFDHIVREWFYRLPKGYADAPYTTEELAILDEVLAENGVNLNEVDQLDQAFLDAEPVEDKKVNEAPKPRGSRVPFSIRQREEYSLKTRDEITSILSSPDADISPQVLKRISKLLSRSGATENIIRENVIQYLGRDASHAEDVLDIMLDGKTDETKLASYLTNRSVPYTTFLNKPVSWGSAFKVTGLSIQALGDLIEYKWSANPNLGIGEVALAMLLDGGSRPNKKGDLLIHGKPFEVGGIGKRLKGQSGFGGANDIRKKFISEYTKLVTQLSADIAMSGGARAIEKPAIPDDTKSWGTAWLTTIQQIHKNILEFLVDENLSFLHDKFVNTLARALTGIFQTADPNDIAAWLDPLINDDGTINIDDFKREFMIYNLLYYINIEVGDDKSQYFALTDYDNLLIFETTRQGIDKVLDYIELYQMAAFTPGAASGIANSIALKQ
jgi:hypothetical protein